MQSYKTAQIYCVHTIQQMAIFLNDTSQQSRQKDIIKRNWKINQLFFTK